MVVACGLKADVTGLRQIAYDFDQAIVVFAGVGHSKAASLTVCELNHDNVVILGYVYCNP